jgi:diguanylate cyclase (GGDEF)-like protein/PAS domain S-box-containing protein
MAAEFRGPGMSMPNVSFIRRKIAQAVQRPSFIASGIALAVTITAGIYADYQNRTIDHQGVRTNVSEQLGLVRAKLEGNINSNIQLVRGLVAVIAANPDIAQQEFAKIAAGLIGSHSQLRNVAAAPDLVIGLMYPMEGNERAIGLDYRQNETQREAALRAVNSKEMVLAGPVNLIQGGHGFIGRFPVFLDGSGDASKLWGLVSAVVDVERLYADSGLADADLPIDIAIAGQDALHDDGTVFFGSPDIFESDPVVSEVSLPSGSWRIAAIPRGGWSGRPDNLWEFRMLIVFAGLLIVLPITIAGFLYDQRRTHIGELARRRDQLQKLSQRLKLALDTSRIGVWELNLDTSELAWDDRMKELYGIDQNFGKVEVRHWSSALHPDDRYRAEVEFQEAIDTGGTYASEFRVLTSNGGIRWIRAIGAVHKNIGGQRHILGVNWDVSEDIEMKTRLMQAKKSAEVRNRELEDARAQMERNSLHDSLTGLPNRRYLDERFTDRRADRRPTALLHIDLDRFKHINDTLGHAAGDAMLVHAASILQSNTRKGDFVARIGGDEFVIAINSPTSKESLSALANRIIEQMREPVPYENHECRFGASIGLAMADRMESGSGNRLLINADIALYRAKSNGRNCFEFFDDSLKAEIVRNKRVADDILSGLERQEFLPYFQPQFDARTLEIVGVEALARWEHPEEGVLAPGVFLKTADELNVVTLIDGLILEQTLWQAKRWEAAGIAIPKFSVNVSAGQLQDEELIERLDGLPIEPGRLSFELLESIYLDDRNDTTTSNIERLKLMGIDIEIDDFGTGYASIVSLIHLRPARLKIERQLITPIVGSDSQRRLVASIIDIGQSLGIQVLAEGVETMEHAAILRDLGCDALQGYAFAAPMPSAELIRFIREERWRKAA